MFGKQLVLFKNFSNISFIGWSLIYFESANEGIESDGLESDFPNFAFSLSILLV